MEIVDGPLKGKKFEFAEHDTFIFGCAPDCHAQLSDDTLVSRHHFLLELNPPLARLRDLGSLNATRVNNRKCGGRCLGCILSDADTKSTETEDLLARYGCDRHYTKDDLAQDRQTLTELFGR